MNEDEDAGVGAQVASLHKTHIDSILDVLKDMKENVEEHLSDKKYFQALRTLEGEKLKKRTRIVKTIILIKNSITKARILKICCTFPFC